jgi:hypothetical protein
VTADGAVPPGKARVFMPSTGDKNSAISGVNSGANAVSDSLVQSPGFFPACTLSSTRRPTILWAWWNGVPFRASASARSVATTQLSSAATRGFSGRRTTVSVTTRIIRRQPRS